MRIIIAGAGNVGTHLAKLLVQENLETTLVDIDSKKLEDVGTEYDLLTHNGSPTSIKTLKSVKVENADLFIAVTPYESVNMTACMLASNMGAKKTLARVDNYEYLQPKNKLFFEQLGVNHLIFPEILAAREIVETLKTSWLRQHLSFADDALILVACKVRSNAIIIDKLFNTGYFDHGRYRVVAIKRKNRTIIPQGSNQIKANDLVFFMTTNEELDFVREQAGKEEYQIRNIMFMGGGRITRETIYKLSEKVNIKILERDKEKCFYLAEKFDEPMVINADARDLEVLKQEDIENMDAFIAATANTEANILACLAAKRFGVRKTIAEVENIDYIRLAESLDIGTIINKKIIAASYIHQITLDADVLDVRNLTLADAQVVEFIAKEKSKVTKSKVKDIKLPDEVNIGGIVRDEKGFTVSGNTQILPGDHVIVFCSMRKIRKLESLFN